MAAEEIVEVLDTRNTADILEQQISQDKEEVDLPDKFRGKSKTDIAKAYSELEKMQGRQAKELGELRQLADSFIKSQLGSKTANTEVTNDGVDETAKPAIDPSFYAQELKKVRRMETELAIRERHPDYQDVVKDPEFVDWIKNSKMRTRLYVQADQEYDFDAADELLSSFKERKVGTKTQEVEEIQKQERTSALKSATTPVGGGGEGTSRKVYRRADLIRLRQFDPQRYNEMADEIASAYAEGRVK